MLSNVKVSVNWQTGKKEVIFFKKKNLFFHKKNRKGK